MLLTKKQFREDLLLNYAELNNAGIKKEKANYFLPPYEWYNDTIAAWTKEMGWQLINYTPGTKSHADYTWPELKNYQSSEAINNSIINYEQSIRGGLNGFILLVHIGTDARRTDKFYLHLPQLVKYLYAKQYHFQTINELLTVD